MLKYAVEGDIRAGLEVEILRVAGGLRRAVEVAMVQVQASRRAEARALSWRDGGRGLANAWRLSKVYPVGAPAARSMSPAGLVFSKMPSVVSAFDQGVTITHKGGKYLCWPTGYNTPGGRVRGSRPKVSPAEMVAAKGQAFTIRSKSNPKVLLWCLRVRTDPAQGAGRMRHLLVGNNIRVGTGNRAGKAAFLAGIIKLGFVPMFILMKSVTLPKSLDLAAGRNAMPDLLARAIAAEFATFPSILTEASR